MDHSFVSALVLLLLVLDPFGSLPIFISVLGKVPRERLFLVEPKLTAEGIQDKGAKSRVDFVLK